jgi:type IV secretion system protein VirB10
MRLRPTRPPVTRLSRKVLLGLGTAAAIGIGGALFVALQPQRQTTGSELYNTGNRSTPDGLANLPRDYTGLPRNVPQLGPALPGDLGRPIVAAGVPAPGMPTPAAGPDPEQQRIAQEQEAARTSTVSPDRIDPPASQYLLQAGAVIPAALITGLRSDLPGLVTAQVTEDVYDSPTGRFLLIPQGARLVGQYDAQVAFGQSRALLVWDRLIMPNGRSIVLERQPGADAAGYAGLEDEVDNHWGMLFKAAILSTILSVGSEAGTSNNENSLVQALRQGASQSFSQVGEQVVGRSLNVQPTITIRPGFPVRVMVTHDLVLEPYPS